MRDAYRPVHADARRALADEALEGLNGLDAWTEPVRGEDATIRVYYRQLRQVLSARRRWLAQFGSLPAWAPPKTMRTTWPTHPQLVIAHIGHRASRA